MRSSVSLLDHLHEVPDFRRRQGRRYPLPKLLAMIIMAILSGHYGYREIARFIKANHDELAQVLRLPRHRVPSHVTIRTVLMHLDFQALSSAFEAWASRHLALAPGDWIALDAKALRSTVRDYDKSYQDFVALVSAFDQQNGVVLSQQAYHHKQVSEIVVTRSLIERLVERLDLRQVTFTLDALHCKKRPSHSSSTAVMTT